MDRIQDSNEQVRAAICKVFGQLDYETTLHQISIDTLKAVGLRLGDKKVGRSTLSIAKLTIGHRPKRSCGSAVQPLGSRAQRNVSKSCPVLPHSTDGSDLDEAEAVAHFAWIPQSILHCLQMRDLPVDGRYVWTVAHI